MNTNLLLSHLFAMHPYKLCIDVDMHRRDKDSLASYLRYSTAPGSEVNTILQGDTYAMVAVDWHVGRGEYAHYEVWAATLHEALTATVNHLQAFGVESDVLVDVTAGHGLDTLIPKCKRGLSICRWDFTHTAGCDKWDVLHEYGDELSAELLEDILETNCFVDVDFGVVGTRNRGVELGSSLDVLIENV